LGVIWKFLVLLTAGALIAAGSLLLMVFYDRYWRWRDCFNDLGRCYDPVSQQVYLEQAGLVWGSLAAGCLIAGLFIASRAMRRRT
jgi:hypothetical protein